MNMYTAWKAGKVVSHGTFTDEDLLKIDFPSPEYVLTYGSMEPLAEPVLSYQDQRRKAYPSLNDFADALYWQSKGDNTKMDIWLDACTKVKENIPKPEIS
jgi:hypothetical protein